LGLSFLDYLYALLMSQHVIFPISYGGFNLICTKLIALAAYLGNWALVAPIIVTKFLLDHCLFLLEAIGVSDFGPFPFQAHLKLAQEFLPSDIVACVFSFHGNLLKWD